MNISSIPVITKKAKIINRHEMMERVMNLESNL
jgi:hypothetical protein